MLTAEEVERYQRDGYVVPEAFRLPAPVLDSIKARHAALLADHPEFRDYCPALFNHDRGFLDYAADPAIIDMVAQLIGQDVAHWESWSHQ